MINKSKLIDKLQDLVYTNENKNNADSIINNFIKLINYIDFTDYRVKLMDSIGLEIRHKAFHKVVVLTYQGKQLYLNDHPIDLEEINKILPTLFF